MREFVERLRLWLLKTETKKCKSCCLTCKYFNQCREELL